MPLRTPIARFYPLTVTAVRKTTRDAVVVSLAPDDPRAFDFVQGQYLTFRHWIDGEDLRRSYSICAGLDDNGLEVAIKRVEGGAFSTWANGTMAAGDRLEAMAPAGNFHLPIDPGRARHYLGFAAGSGITPILSILRTVLAREPRSRFTLVYANRAVHSVMFRKELEDLKNRHMQRLNLVHILGDGALDIDLFSGRLDADKCVDLFARWIDVGRADSAFICGPEPMMRTIAAALESHGMPKEAIRYELFATGRSVAAQTTRAETEGEGAMARVTLDGESRTLNVAPGTTILEAALASHIDAPHACKAGVCSTCKAFVTEGEVEMIANHALEDYEVERGYVLTCQSLVRSKTVAVTYDR